MTEREIEMAVEQRTDHIDHIYMTTNMTEAEYNIACTALNDWAKVQYEKISPKILH